MYPFSIVVFWDPVHFIHGLDESFFTTILYLPKDSWVSWNTFATSYCLNHSIKLLWIWFLFFRQLYLLNWPPHCNIIIDKCLIDKCGLIAYRILNISLHPLSPYTYLSDCYWVQHRNCEYQASPTQNQPEIHVRFTS